MTANQITDLRDSMFKAGVSASAFNDPHFDFPDTPEWNEIKDLMIRASGAAFSAMTKLEAELAKARTDAEVTANEDAYLKRYA